MNRTLLLSTASLFCISCAGGGAEPSADMGGGNVGFGGAQDIGQFRDIVERGDIPGPSTLDANGFFSEHYIELPAPDCGERLCLHAMVGVGADWLTGEYQATMQLAMNTPLDPDDFEPRPLDLVVVVDTSGSMASDLRLDYVKQGLELLVDELGTDDRLAIVTYSSEARLMRGLDFVGDRGALVESIATLSPNGGTNIYDALAMGMAIAQENLDLERQARLILLSDGNATSGITSDEAIIGVTEGYIEEGIGLTTIGVGNDFNVDLMRGLSERGAGNFYYVEDAPAVVEVFSDELDYFVEPIALSVNLDAAASASHRMGEVLGTRLWKTEGSSGSMFIPAVFLASRKSNETEGDGRRGGGSTLFIDMEPLGGENPELMAELTLSYRLPGETNPVVVESSPQNPHPDEIPEDVYVSHQAMKKGVAVYNIFRGLRQATREAETDYGCALETVELVQMRATRWNSVNNDPDVEADIELINQLRRNLTSRSGGASSCENSVDFADDDWTEHHGHDDVRGPVLGCSAASSASSSSLWLLALSLLWLRRRRLTR